MFFLQRIINGAPDLDGDTWEASVDLDIYNKSTINGRMDITNQHIWLTLQLKFHDAFKKFSEQLVILPNIIYLQILIIHKIFDILMGFGKYICIYISF